MTDKKTIGYIKSNVGQIDWFKLMTMPKSVFKDKNEPFEQWFNRKVEEQSGGMDEQGMSRNGDAQSPKPLL